ncbi:MAG: CCE_0567 family metalloprotein [Hyphomicrobiales bacterium]
MTDELKDLRKATKRTRRIAGEKAMELHDLVEDRLPEAYEELMLVAGETYEACKAWAAAEAELAAAEAALESKGV